MTWKELAKYRRDAHLTQGEFAERLGLNRASLSRIEGCDFAINVAGSSMYPSIESGSMILCKKVTDKTIIMYGEVYFVVTNDYRMVKRVRKSTKRGYVVCASDNHNGHDHPDGKTYADIELPIDKIVHLYLVKGSIKRHQI